LENQSREGRRRTFVNAPMLHPVRRESSVRRSPWWIVRNASEHLRDITAPDWVVAGQLRETAIDADVLHRHLTVRAANMEVVIDGRLEDWTLAQTSLGVLARVDCTLENGILGSVPTVLEVSVAGVPYVVTSRQDEAAIVIFEALGMGDLLDEDGHEPNGVGGRAGTSFLRTDRVRDVVLEVGARGVPTIPARREQDLDANAVGTVTFWEGERLWDGSLIEAEAMVVEGLFPGISAHRASVGLAGDHAEPLGELLNVGFCATMQVVDGPVRGDELELAGVPVLVVEIWSPVVGLVVLDCDGRARALEERIGVVGISKFVATHYAVNMLTREPSGGGVTKRKSEIELTDATALGETRGSIRAVSKGVESIRQLALTSCVNETRRSASVERSVDDMIVLAI